MVDATRLQQALDYQFGDVELLDLALTHCSVGRRNNERLEFLGDSILNHIIAEFLYRQFPSCSEGDMTRMRAALVNGETLAEVATELGLGEYLRLGAGVRKSGGRRHGSILADTLEALAGAVLLDSDVESCRRCVLGWFAGRLQNLSPSEVGKDAKTQLQEYLQGRNYPLPEYDLVTVTGDDHAQEFLVACRLQKPRLMVEGSGASRRKAEQDAANAALNSIARHGN